MQEKSSRFVKISYFFDKHCRLNYITRSKYGKVIIMQYFKLNNGSIAGSETAEVPAQACAMFTVQAKP